MLIKQEQENLGEQDLALRLQKKWLRPMMVEFGQEVLKEKEQRFSLVCHT